MFLINDFINEYINAKNTLPLLKIFNVFYTFGNVCKENYLKLYSSDIEYEEEIIKTENLLDNDFSLEDSISL